MHVEGKGFVESNLGRGCQHFCLHLESKLHQSTEAQHGKKPFVSHFRTFGCDFYVHVPNKERNKLQPKSTNCIFLGYSDDKKAYKLYNPATNKIVSSHDVVLKEKPHAMKDEEKSSFLSPCDEATYYEPGPSVIPNLKDEEELSK